MNAVGVNVSKGKSMATVRHPFNESVAKPFEVRHTGSELKQLADYLKCESMVFDNHVEEKFPVLLASLTFGIV